LELNTAPGTLMVVIRDQDGDYDLLVPGPGANEGRKDPRPKKTRTGFLNPNR